VQGEISNPYDVAAAYVSRIEKSLKK